MTLTVTVQFSDANCAQDWKYNCAVDLPEKTSMEDIEAHAKNLVRILDEQAQKHHDEEDETA